MKSAIPIAVIGWLLLDFIPYPKMLAAEAGPSFNCTKARTQVERAICGDAVISKLDFALAQTYADAAAEMQPDDKAAFKSSQRNWLKARDAACLNRQQENNPDKQEISTCLVAVYHQRLSEIGDETSVLNPITEQRSYPVNLDVFLDRQLNDDGASLFKTPGDFSTGHDIKTCRDYFIFKAAGWEAGLDTVSMSQASGVDTTCRFELAKFQATKPTKLIPPSFDVADPLNYSSDFASLGQGGNGENFDGRSFRELERQGKIKLVRNYEPSFDDVFNIETPATPIVYLFQRGDHKGIYAGDGYYSFLQLAKGDFDGTGEEKVVMEIAYRSTGTFNYAMLVIARYDPSIQALRPDSGEAKYHTKRGKP